MSELSPILDGNKKTGSHWHWKWKGSGSYSHRPVITVDFDHTITKTCPACPDWNGKYVLQDGVKAALTTLSGQFDIVILTGGGNYVRGYSDVVGNFLKLNGIPFARIEDDKPPAVFMIDDRAIRHEGWNKTLREIERRMLSK